MDPLSQILDHWTKYRSFVLLAHIRPDGDAVGSLFGLAHLLSAQGKKGHILLPDGLPERFSWLISPWPVCTSLPHERKACFVALDCADKNRLGTGKVATDHLLEDTIVNIDHHTGNSFFGTLNWVNPEISSVGEMIALAARRLNTALCGPLAEALYLAIMSDTGSLSYSNTSPQTLDIVSEILASGLDMNAFQAKMQRQWGLEKLHLHGRAMQNVSLRWEGKIGIIRATQDMLAQTGASSEDCDGLVDYVRCLRGVVIAVSLREAEEGIKFSLRTWGEVDVQGIAAKLGGGGHPNAAGGMLAGDMDQAEQRILQAASPHLAEISTAL
ncbi:MAG: DHH family phosphoesterase [Thermodesulfobacteriota bacterium]